MKYRKKPIIIEAYQTDVELDIETLEGIMHASVGDYIITGINGEKYPCKPDIFEKTYELVEENNYETSKELKALERIKKVQEVADYMEKETDIIETALKDYDNLLYKCNKLQDKKQKLLIEKAKHLKALEIIKEKEVNVYLLNYFGSLESYNEEVCIFRMLNQEEYDLLKEVLL